MLPFWKSKCSYFFYMLYVCANSVTGSSWMAITLSFANGADIMGEGCLFLYEWRWTFWNQSNLLGSNHTEAHWRWAIWFISQGISNFRIYFYFLNSLAATSANGFCLPPFNGSSYSYSLNLYNIYLITLYGSCSLKSFIDGSIDSVWKYLLTSPGYMINFENSCKVDS